MSFPSFFGGLFSELIPGGGDCSSIEQDPNADPFDKEVCQQLRRFNDAFGRNLKLDIEHRSIEEESSGREERSDPQSLRDAILNRPDCDREEMPRCRWDRGFGRHYERRPKEDEDLDDRVRSDPRLLDKYLDSDTEPRSQHEESPHFHSSYSSVIITTNPDGTVEERRRVIDSDGNQKTTVTYSDDGRQRADRRIGIQGKMKEFWDRISKL